MKAAAELGTKEVDVQINENKEWDPSIPFYQHAPELILTEYSPSMSVFFKELVKKNMARINLNGDDPYKYQSIDPKRKSLSNQPWTKARKKWMQQLTNTSQWTIYYLPVTASAKAAGYRSLKKAAVDVPYIVRRGGLEKHLQDLHARQDQLNRLVEQGYRTLHFVSVNPITRQPNGKTDLKVSLTTKSKFVTGTMETTSGRSFIPNIPSEEVYTTPDWRKTEGHA